VSELERQAHEMLEAEQRALAAKNSQERAEQRTAEQTAQALRDRLAQYVALVRKQGIAPKPLCWRHTGYVSYWFPTWRPTGHDAWWIQSPQFMGKDGTDLIGLVVTESLGLFEATDGGRRWEWRRYERSRPQLRDLIDEWLLERWNNERVHHYLMPTIDSSLTRAATSVLARKYGANL
jgi:hypothetical protein